MNRTPGLHRITHLGTTATVAALSLVASGTEAATVFQAVGTYPGLSGSGPVEFQATTDTGNQLSHATFKANVEAAFLEGTGGVLDYELANEDNAAPGSNGVDFASGAYRLGINQTFNQAGSNGRSPTSGTHMTTYGSDGVNNINFGPIFDALGNPLPDLGVTQVGYVVLSPNSTGVNPFPSGGTGSVTYTLTAFFSGGGSASASRDIFAGSTQDTFFGFVAPNGETITTLAVDQGDANVFFGGDDIGFVTNVPEPASVALLLAGLPLIARRRR